MVWGSLSKLLIQNPERGPHGTPKASCNPYVYYLEADLDNLRVVTRLGRWSIRQLARLPAADILRKADCPAAEGLGGLGSIKPEHSNIEVGVLIVKKLNAYS